MYQETFRPPFALLVYAIAAIVAVSIGVLLFANLSEAGEVELEGVASAAAVLPCLLYTSPSPRDQRGSRMPSSA